MTLQLPSFLDTSSAKRRSRLFREKSYMETWQKIFKPNGGDWRRKLGDQWEYFSHVEKLISVRGLCRWWKTSQPSYRRLKRKTRQENQLMKNHSNLDWRKGKKNLGFWWEKGLWSRKDLVEIKCYLVLSRVELQMVPSTKMQASQYSLRQKDKSPASCLPLALLKTKLTWIPPSCLTWHTL